MLGSRGPEISEQGPRAVIWLARQTNPQREQGPHVSEVMLLSATYGILVYYARLAIQ